MNIRLSQNTVRVRLELEEAGFLGTGGTAHFALPVPLNSPVHVLVSLQTQHEKDALEWGRHSIHVRINPRTLEKMLVEDVEIDLGGRGNDRLHLQLEVDRFSKTKG